MSTLLKPFFIACWTEMNWYPLNCKAQMQLQLLLLAIEQPNSKRQQIVRLVGVGNQLQYLLLSYRGDNICGNFANRYCGTRLGSDRNISVFFKIIMK